MAKTLNEKELVKFLNKNGRKDISLKLKHGINFPPEVKKEIRIFYMGCTYDIDISGSYEVITKNGKSFVELDITRVFNFRVNMEPNLSKKPKFEFKTIPETAHFSIECDPSQIP